MRNLPLHSPARLSDSDTVLGTLFAIGGGLLLLLCIAKPVAGLVVLSALGYIAHRCCR
jgi:hypothetical protein